MALFRNKHSVNIRWAVKVKLNDDRREEKEGQTEERHRGGTEHEEGSDKMRQLKPSVSC
jgi:hypothetical protein